MGFLNSVCSAFSPHFLALDSFFEICTALNSVTNTNLQCSFTEEALFFYLLPWQTLISLYNVPGLVLGAEETKINKGHVLHSQAHDGELGTDLYRETK